MNNLTLIDKAFLLKKTPMFSALELDVLLSVADKMGFITVEPNQIIFDINENAFSMFLIIQGSVVLSNGQGEVLFDLEKGDFFGDEAVFTSRPRAYRALTTTKTHMLTLSRSDLMAIINEYPKVAVGFIEVYAKANPVRTPIKEREVK